MSEAKKPFTLHGEDLRLMISSREYDQHKIHQQSNVFLSDGDTGTNMGLT